MQECVLSAHSHVLLLILTPARHTRARGRPARASRRRNYDVYLGRAQFAAIREAPLAWGFELKDEAGRALAMIDRNFSGFGIELLTDAGAARRGTRARGAPTQGP